MRHVVISAPVVSDICANQKMLKKWIRAGSDLLLNISLSGGQSLKVDQNTSAKRK